MDFRRNTGDNPPLTIDGSTVERVSSTKFLGVHITEDLTLTPNITLLSKKVQQRLHFLRRLKRASLPPPSLTTFYRGSIESVCWPAASLSGTGIVVQQTARPSSGQWTQLQRSSVPLSPPSWTFSLHDAPAKQIVSWRCTMHCILNFTSHVYNFFNKYKQSDIWTEPLIYLLKESTLLKGLSRTGIENRWFTHSMSSPGHAYQVVYKSQMSAFEVVGAFLIIGALASHLPPPLYAPVTKHVCDKGHQKSFSTL